MDTPQNTLRKLSAAAKREARFLCQFGATSKPAFPTGRTCSTRFRIPEILTNALILCRI